MTGPTKSGEKIESPKATSPAYAPMPAVPLPGLGPASIQQAAGNMAVQRLLRDRAIQAKLTISQPGDPYEQEADRVAEQVVNDATQPTVPRRCACGSIAGPGGECRACRAKRLQRSATNLSTPVGIPLIIHDALRSSGQSLDPATRSFMEPRFGYNFGGVRVHTGPQAADAAQAISAQAFTVGQDIVFGAGQYTPMTTAGKSLVAHELTHVVQQRTDTLSLAPQNTSPSELIIDLGDPLEREAKTVTRQVGEDRLSAPTLITRTAPTGLLSIMRQESQPVTGTTPTISEAVQATVDSIIDALSGYTSRWDSANILAHFQGKDPSTVQAIVQELKNRASSHGETAEGMVNWLLGDMTAEDRRTLRQIFVQARLPDIRRIVASEVLGLLSGYTSASNSAEIYNLLSQFGGADLDSLLEQLQAQAGQNRNNMSVWLFDDLESASAERVRQHFFQSGGPTAATYAVIWTTSKIYDLLSGYTSHADSTAIVTNFRTTPEGYRILVQQQLEERTRSEWGQSAEDALMKNMDQADYEALRSLGSLRLRSYDHQPSLLERAVSTVEWGAVFLEWTTCGMIGLATGLLSVIWDILVGLWDIGVAIWHLLWSLIYLISGGAAGSSNWLAVKDFFTGLSALANPGQLWDQYWENLKLEFSVIEGPLSDCRRAEFVVRRFINALVNIVLLFIPVYGAAKAAVSAARGVTELTTLVRQVGVLRTLAQIGTGVRRTLGAVVTVAAEDIARLATLLRYPVQTLIRVGQRINIILIAVREEGVWAYLRGRVGVLAENERQFWNEQRRFWRERAEGYQARHSGLSDEAGSFADELERNRAPERGDDVAQRISDDTNQLDRDVEELNRNVTDPDRGPAPTREAGVNRAAETIRHTVCGFCFPAGTKVLTMDGYTNIEDVRPGDLVLAKHEVFQGPNSYRRVLSTFQNISNSLIEVTIGSQCIKSTPGHVWWVTGKGWILAQELAVGNTVITSEGNAAPITSIRHLDEFAITYNCEVEEYHTYFVAAQEGKPGIWVHNNSLGVRVLRPDQVYQLLIPNIVITDREAIRSVIRGSLEATGSYSTELGGLYQYLRRGGGAGYVGVTADAINRLEIVLQTIENKGGGVVAAIDLQRIGAQRIFELSDPAVMNRLLRAYPRFENMFGELASEGVVAVRGNIPARAVQSLVNIPENLSDAEKRLILQELLRPCQR